MEAHQKTVKLWYLGGLEPQKKDEETKTQKVVGRPVVMTGGNAFTLPLPGNYIEVEQWIAVDLMKRYKSKVMEFFSTIKPGEKKAVIEKRPYTDEEIAAMDEERLVAALEYLKSKSATEKKSSKKVKKEPSIFEDDEIENILEIGDVVSEGDE